jgi:hypothetical protein
MSTATKIEINMRDQAVNYLVAAFKSDNNEQIKIWQPIVNKFKKNKLLTFNQQVRITNAIYKYLEYGKVKK